MRLIRELAIECFLKTKPERRRHVSVKVSEVAILKVVTYPLVNASADFAIAVAVMHVTGIEACFTVHFLSFFLICER